MGSPTDREHTGIHVGRRIERPTGDASSDRDFKCAAPSANTGSVRSGPASRCLLLKDQMSRDQAASRLQEAFKQRRGDRERGVGHDMVRTPWQTKVACVGFDEGDRLAEAAAKIAGPLWVRFNSDDAHLRVDQRRRYRSHPGADVDDPRARKDVRVSDELLRPSTVELMPSPGTLRRGHGDGP